MHCITLYHFVKYTVSQYHVSHCIIMISLSRSYARACAICFAIAAPVFRGVYRQEVRVVWAARFRFYLGIGDLIAIEVGVIRVPHARHIILAIWYVIPVEEGIGLHHPKGIFIVLSPRAGSLIEGFQVAVSAIRKITVSIFRTSSVIDAIGLQGIPRHAATTAAAHAYGSRWIPYQ